MSAETCCSSVLNLTLDRGLMCGFHRLASLCTYALQHFGPICNFSLVFRTMASNVETSAATCRCAFCGLEYPPDSGRQHGKAFRCTQCLSIERTMRRHLGDASELREFTPDEASDFFKRLVENKTSGHLQWQTIRASLVKKLTEKKITSHERSVEIEELPLSVLVQRGWQEEVIRRFPSFDSEEYGCELFKVPVKKQTWAEVFQNIEEMILERERQATKKRGAKAADMDVPEAGPSGETSDKKEARQQAKAEKKKEASNLKTSTVAAKSLGSLTSMEASLSKLITKGDTVSEADAAALALCKDTLITVKRWGEASRMAVNQQEQNKQRPEGESHVELLPLPFDGADLKVLLKQGQEGQKALRESFPKPKPKEKAAAKVAAIPGGEGAEEPAPKRRRGKSAA